ncbi:MAG: flagellar basal body L-ring protein FlgH [Calditrichaeota bacterium]|nr:flagellar basal body L-ring protein FlgH [Calditrichota bacterium]MCB0267589.1 flagellar basal body L-ring protein FlgH [Calditrichota bacterium]
MKKTQFLSIVLLLVSIAANAQQDMGKSMSLFTDNKANKVGKGITVLVMEFSQASNEAKTESKKQTTNNVGIEKGTGMLQFLPEFGINGKTQNDFKGDARTSRKGSLRAKIAARIVGVNDAGDYVIEGKRVVETNNEKEVYSLEGAVRPEDIMADNTVFSYNIYDAHIIYKGKGEVARAQKPGVITRFLQWLF